MKLAYLGHRYLQKFDIVFILRNTVNPPASFRNECAKLQIDGGIEPVDTQDMCTFVGPFKNPESIAWIDELDYLVSYNDHANDTPRAITKSVRQSRKELNIYEESQRALYHDVFHHRDKDIQRAAHRQVVRATHKVAAFEIMRKHLENDSKFTFAFPDGYDPPQQTTPQKLPILERLFGHYRIP